MSKYAKIHYILLLFSLLLFNFAFGVDSEYKNTLTKIEVVKTAEDSYNVKLHTKNALSHGAKVIKKSDYSYYILLPETKNVAASPAVSEDIKHIGAVSYPYAGTGSNNGYIKINISTTKPVKFSVSSIASNQANTSKTVTIPNTNTQAKIAAKPQSNTNVQVKTQQKPSIPQAKTTQSPNIQVPNVTLAKADTKQTVKKQETKPPINVTLQKADTKQAKSQQPLSVNLLAKLKEKKIEVSKPQQNQKLAQNTQNTQKTPQKQNAVKKEQTQQVYKQSAQKPQPKQEVKKPVAQQTKTPIKNVKPQEKPKLAVKPEIKTEKKVEKQVIKQEKKVKEVLKAAQKPVQNKIKQHTVKPPKKQKVQKQQIQELPKEDLQAQDLNVTENKETRKSLFNFVDFLLLLILGVASYFGAVYVLTNKTKISARIKDKAKYFVQATKKASTLKPKKKPEKKKTAPVVMQKKSTPTFDFSKHKRMQEPITPDNVKQVVEIPLLPNENSTFKDRARYLEEVRRETKILDDILKDEKQVDLNDPKFNVPKAEETPKPKKGEFSSVNSEPIVQPMDVDNIDLDDIELEIEDEDLNVSDKQLEITNEENLASDETTQEKAEFQEEQKTEQAQEQKPENNVIEDVQKQIEPEPQQVQKGQEQQTQEQKSIETQQEKEEIKTSKPKKIVIPKDVDPSTPYVITSVEIAPLRGFMCVLYNNSINLMGYILDDVFALYNFKKPELDNYKIKFRMSQKTAKAAQFIVRVDKYKLLINVTKQNMKFEIKM